jgi:hypothetical protein
MSYLEEPRTKQCPSDLQNEIQDALFSRISTSHGVCQLCRMKQVMPYLEVTEHHIVDVSCVDETYDAFFRRKLNITQSL